MKFFGWMQNKLSCKQVNKKPNMVHATRHMKQDSREHFNDWPQGLLAIGTFGNNDLRHHNHNNVEIQQDFHQEALQEDEDTSPSDDLQDFTPEEIGRLKKELTKLLSKMPTTEKKDKQIASLPLDRFLNCPSTLEVSRRLSNKGDKDDKDDDDDIERTINVILGRCKDIRENKQKAIGKKSSSFLFKKMFECRSEFVPQPSFRNMLQESRIEKLLRTFLHKRINPQNASRASSSKKKFLQDKQASREGNEDEKQHKIISDGPKWVKTDSEYIVLEI